MNLLRKPPFPLVATVSGLANNTAYIATIANNRNEFIADVSVTSNGSGSLSINLPERLSRYDGDYALIVYSLYLGEKSAVVATENISVRRPYVDAAQLAPSSQDEAKYWKHERRARLMIDAIVGGFYYQDLLVQANGVGSDSLFIGSRVCKLLKVIENNVLMYEVDGTNNVANYTMSTNLQSLIIDNSGQEVNEFEGGLLITGAQSDSYDNPGIRSVAFPNGYDYTVQIESGWPSVPGDIQEVSEIIVEDLACDSPNYIQRYIREYETKDFRADFQRSAFAGTGILVVDQVLQKYWEQNLYNNIRMI
jgi:hypothetical protein